MNTAVNAPRRRQRMAFALAIILSGVGGTWWWYVEHAQWREVTDNAYVKGNLVRIAGKVPGQVVKLAFEEGDRVEAGSTVAVLAPGDAERSVEEAKHVLGFAVHEVLTRRAAVAAAEAQLELRRTTQTLADQEYQRRQALVSKQTVSQEEVDAARTRASETRAELRIAERNLAKAKVQAGDGPLAAHPMINVAAAQLRDAIRTLNKHTIISPISGVVAQRYAQMGQVIEAGSPIYTIVEADNVWVEANFKENQLNNLRPGQAVTATADLYGDEHVFSGHIANIGVGTGAEFSVLPPQNATGNWIKIVQRVPIRIDLEPTALHEFPLPVGASLTVTVDTHQRERPRYQPTENRGQISSNAVFEDLDRGADAMINEVIAQYSSWTGATTAQFGR